MAAPNRPPAPALGQAALGMALGIPGDVARSPHDGALALSRIEGCLAAYQKLFGADPNWIFATGDQTALKELWALLGVNHEQVGEGAGPVPRDWWTGVALTYDIQHQDVVYVIDPHGHLRWFDNGTPNTMGSAPPPTMLRFLSAQGKQNLASPIDPTWTVKDIE